MFTKVNPVADLQKSPKIHVQHLSDLQAEDLGQFFFIAESVLRADLEILCEEFGDLSDWVLAWIGHGVEKNLQLRLLLEVQFGNPIPLFSPQSESPLQSLGPPVQSCVSFCTRQPVS